MSTLQNTDVFAVTRGTTTYKVSFADIAAGVQLPPVLLYKGSSAPAATAPAPAGGLKAGMVYVLTPAGTLDASWIGIGGRHADDGQLAIWEGAKWELVGNSGAIPDATETVKGIVELATAAETATGTDATRAVHPAGLKVELDKKVNKAGDTMTGNLTVPSLNGGQLAGTRNVLINGDLRINQRGVTIAAAAVGKYGPDRWKKVDASHMTQIVEDVNFIHGATYTLSGTGVTTQQLTAPASGHWTLPKIPITATNIQLEIGTVATPFEHQPQQIARDLCRRYYTPIKEAQGIPCFWAGAAGHSNVIIPLYDSALNRAGTVVNGHCVCFFNFFNNGASTEEYKTVTWTFSPDSNHLNIAYLTAAWDTSASGLTGWAAFPAGCAIDMEL
jgi:hypothetical protein